MNVYLWPQQLKKLSVSWLENSDFTKCHVFNHNLTHPVLLPVDEFKINITRSSESHEKAGDTAKSSNAAGYITSALMKVSNKNCRITVALTNK